jgi:membrane protease YdiL (CAAX protease family)
MITGKKGVRALFHPIHRWRVGIHWYILVLFYPAAVRLVARAIDIILGQSYEFPFMPLLTYFGPNYTFMVIIALVFALPNTLGEELGWRGFALPKLQEKYNALVSSIILGIFWGLWHIPLWIAFGQTAVPLLINVIGIVGTAILFTWVFNSTKESLLLVWIFHFAMTVTGYLLSPIPTLTDEIISWIIIVIIIYITGRHLSQK